MVQEGLILQIKENVQNTDQQRNIGEALAIEAIGQESVIKKANRIHDTEEREAVLAIFSASEPCREI